MGRSEKQLSQRSRVLLHVELLLYPCASRQGQSIGEGRIVENGLEPAGEGVCVAGRGEQPVHTVVDRLDNCPDEPGSPENFGCKKKQRVALVHGRIRLLETVHFATARARIRRRSYPLLNDVARVLAAHGEIKKVEVIGHTDSRGTDEYNLELSRDRAQAVTEYLMMARACPCVHVTTAALPTGMRDGPTCAEGAG